MLPPKSATKATPLLNRLEAISQTAHRKDAGVALPQLATSGGLTLSQAGHSGGLTWRGFETERDAARTIGNPLENSLIYAALDWQCITFQQAPFIVKRRGDRGIEETVLDHPLTRLMKRPNPEWSRSRFLRASLLSRFFDGNSYWHIARDGENEPAELWWLHYRATKAVPNKQTGHLSHYEYKVKNRTIRIEKDDMVHIRDGVDPDNPLAGFSRYRALMPHIATDVEAANYEAIMLHNLGVPGAVISPPTEDGKINDSQADKIAATYTSRTTGRERGRPMVFNVPVKLDFPALSPAQFGLEHIHEQVEARVSMVTKLPAVVLQMLFAIKNQSAKAGLEEMEKVAWRWNIIPTQDEFTEEIDTQLLPQMGDPDSEWTEFDRSQIEALQEDRNAKHKRNQGDFTSGICDRAEARGAVDYKVRPEDEGVWSKAKTGNQDDEKTGTAKQGAEE